MPLSYKIWSPNAKVIYFGITHLTLKEFDEKINKEFQLWKLGTHIYRPYFRIMCNDDFKLEALDLTLIFPPTLIADGKAHVMSHNGSIIMTQEGNTHFEESYG